MASGGARRTLCWKSVREKEITDIPFANAFGAALAAKLKYIAAKAAPVALDKLLRL